MSLRTSDFFSGLVLAGALVACGGAARATPTVDTLDTGFGGAGGAGTGGAGGAPHDEAGTDATGGAPMDDAQPDNAPGCGGDAVWTPASLTFKLTSSGGFVSPPPPDSGCTFVGSTFDFSLPAATLEEQTCNSTGRHEPLVHLSPSEVGAVVAAVGALRTTCVKRCGFDAPIVKLTVRASGIETTYTGNFYAGCPSQMDTPPFVENGNLVQLLGSLHQIVREACRPDAGPRDAGACEMR